MGGRI